MKTEVSAGGIVFRVRGAGVEVLLMRDRFGRWTFPKGHQDPGEAIETTALREIEEETGILGRILDYVGEIEYSFVSEGHLINKKVHLYLVEAISSDLNLNDFEAKDAQWVGLEEIESHIGYPDLADLIQKGITRLGNLSS